MRMQRLVDLSEAPDVASFEKQLLELTAEMDFGLFTAMVVTELPDSPAHVVRVANTPQAFVNASMSLQDSARDPVMQGMKKLSVPFVYDQNTYVKAGAGDLWEQQAAFGYKTGIAVALHLPGQRHFTLSFDRENPLPNSDSELVRMLGDLQLLVVYAQSSALRLFERPRTVKLTRKEQMVLRLTMEGKSSKAISAEMFCAEATVNFHIHNIRTKFDVTSKHQAVRLAQAAGLI